MSQPIIHVENVSKRYMLGQFSARTMREELERVVQRFRHKEKTADDRNARTHSSEFWALKDVSFSVLPGEVIGIVGRNGAGKSTLLKILSRITEPTKGEIRLRGRVASLLEVGTGFHPELTGRENIYLNGAILGMTIAEVRAKFDEIVAFSEIERFLDTPVKRYSSGMYMRLAFAVAAHLEPEILVVDEVLAVGDAEFQKKCLGKIQSVSAQGDRTVLFVSHNLQAVGTLCSRTILLEDGQMALCGQSSSVLEHYLKQIRTATTAVRDQIWVDPATAPGNDRIRLHRIRLLADTNVPMQDIALDTPICVEIEYWNLVPDTKVLVNLVLYSIDGTEILEDWSAEEQNWRGRGLPQGLFKTICRLPGNLLNDGTYRVRIVFFDADSVRIIYDRAEAVAFSVHDIEQRPVNWHGRFIGNVHPKLGWSTHLVKII